MLDNDPPATLALFKSLGATRVRLFIRWSAIAPDSTSRRAPAGFDASNPSAYAPASWATDDTIIRDAKAAGIGIDLTVGPGVPTWAEGPGEPKGGVVGVWKPSAVDFGEFMHALGVRYSGHYTPPGSTSPLPKINFWAMWNEPNYGQDLAPQAIDHTKVEVSPRLYRGLVDAAWKALHATGHGGDTFLFGETAPRGQTQGNHPGNFDGMVPLRFLRALYCVDADYRPLQGAAAAARGCPATAAGAKAFPRQNPALFHATGYSDHPYPQGELAPNVREADEPDFADLASLPELESTLDRSQAAYGQDTKLPIYSTEFGYQTDPPEPGRPSPAAAAAYLNWSEYISWLDPRVRSYDQYLVRDPTTGGASSFVTGLEFANGTPKPTFAAFRMPLFLPRTHVQAGGRLEVWGCVRPAPYAARATHRPQSVRIQFAAGTGGAFRTVRDLRLTTPHGYFDTAVSFPGSGRVRLAWTPPHGTEMFSRVVTVSVG